MTENQEKELFRTLENLVGGMQKIQHTQAEHTGMLNEHTGMLNEHTGILNSLIAKTDSIARQVMDNDERLTARITSVENAVGNLGGGIH
ncbi:MAG: hypothetical protein ABL999_19760 [Pyrinomonadaceae bacterium]